MIKTTIFKMNRMAFLKEMFKLYGLPWIAIFGFLLIFSTAASIFQDIRWIVIALILICMILPMLMAFFYIYHGMREVTVINALPHSLEFRDNDIEATLYSAVRNEETGEIEYHELSKRNLPYEGVKRYHPGLTSVIIPFDKGMKGFIWLPVSAFEGGKDMAAAIDKLISGMRCGNPN